MPNSNVTDLLRNAREIVSDIQADISEFSKMLDQKVSPIESEVDQLKDTFNPYVNIESLPGARTPKWYAVEIDFQAGETQSKSRAIEISSEGAFVLKSMQCVYLILDEDPQNYVLYKRNPSTYSNLTLPVGIHLPTTTYPILAEGTLQSVIALAPTSPITNATVSGANSLYEYPEFSVGFELESKGIQLTERPIPSAFIYSVNSPLYISSKCYVDRGERLIVTARPDARVPLKGKFRLILHGYQVLGDIDPKPLRRLR